MFEGGTKDKKVVEVNLGVINKARLSVKGWILYIIYDRLGLLCQKIV